MQRERDRDREVGAQPDRWTGNPDNRLSDLKRRNSLADHLGKIRASPALLGQYVVNFGERHQPSRQALPRARCDAAGAQGLLSHRLDGRKSILDPMVELVEKENAMLGGQLGGRLVTHDLQQRALSRMLERHHDPVCPEPFLIPPDMPAAVLGAATVKGRADLERADARRKIRRRQENIDALTDRRTGRVASYSLGSRAPTGDHPIGSQRKDSEVPCILDDQGRESRVGEHR